MAERNAKLRYDHGYKQRCPGAGNPPPLLSTCDRFVDSAVLDNGVGKSMTSYINKQGVLVWSEILPTSILSSASICQFSRCREIPLTEIRPKGGGAVAPLFTTVVPAGANVWFLLPLVSRERIHPLYACLFVSRGTNDSRRRFQISTATVGEALGGSGALVPVGRDRLRRRWGYHRRAEYEARREGEGAAEVGQGVARVASASSQASEGRRLLGLKTNPRFSRAVVMKGELYTCLRRFRHGFRE